MASAAFVQALELIENHPGYSKADKEQEGELAYNAGIASYTAQSYEDAIKYLSKAEELGYEADGQIYWFLYYSYKGMAAGDSEALLQAEPIIERGFAKYSENENVVDSIIDFYIATGKDTAVLVATVKQSVDNDSENPVLWNGLARLYDGLEDYDNSIAAFAEVAELLPDSFGAFYSQGVLYIKKADSIMEVANSAVHLTQASYDAAMAPALDEYRNAIAPLEKAHELNPADKTTVVILQNVTNRLRNEPGMQEKNDKYKALQEQMQ
jgi:tetratricopeptide (TPR) repeat protein